MKNFIKFISPVVLILLFSCFKDNQTPTTVRGVVINKLTNEPIKGIPVTITECPGWFAKCLDSLTTVYTDVNGNYKVEFIGEKNSGYVVGVDRNVLFSSSGYPNYNYLTKKTDNVYNFSLFPIKTLVTKVKVLRHDKNWLHIYVSKMDDYNYFLYDYHNAVNPFADYDKTHTINIEAGRKYRLVVALWNKTAQNTFIDNENFYKDFTVNNVDTTSVELIVQ